MFVGGAFAKPMPRGVVSNNEKQACFEVLNEQVQANGHSLEINNYTDFQEKLRTEKFGKTVFQKTPLAQDPLTRITLWKKLFFKDEVNFGEPTGFTTSAGTGQAAVYSWDSGYTEYPNTGDDVTFLSTLDPATKRKKLSRCRNQHQVSVDSKYPLVEITDDLFGIADGPNFMESKIVTKNGKNFKVLSLVRKVHRAKSKDFLLDQKEIYVIPENPENDFFNLYNKVEDFIHYTNFLVRRGKIIQRGPGWEPWEENKNVRVNRTYMMVEYHGILSNADQIIKVPAELTRSFWRSGDQIYKYVTRGIPPYETDAMENKLKLLNWAHRYTDNDEVVRLGFGIYMLDDREMTLPSSGKNQLSRCGIDDVGVSEYVERVSELQREYGVSEVSILDREESEIEAYVKDRFAVEDSYRDVLLPCNIKLDNKRREAQELRLSMPIDKVKVDYSNVEKMIKIREKVLKKVNREREKKKCKIDKKDQSELDHLSADYQNKIKSFNEAVNKQEIDGAKFKSELNAISLAIQQKRTAVSEKCLAQKNKLFIGKRFLLVFSFVFVLTVLILIFWFRAKNKSKSAVSDEESVFEGAVKNPPVSTEVDGEEK